MSFLQESKVVDGIVNEIFDSIPGMLSYEEGNLFFTLASKCKSGAIVEIGSAHGRSTTCFAMGSKYGNRMPVYSIDPHNGVGATPDNGHDPRGLEYHPGNPNIKYYINQGKSYDAFVKNLNKFNVWDIVHPIVNYSELAYKEWVPQDIELLFIDADHRFEYVKMDFLTWGKHLINGGLLIFHDHAFPGVHKVIQSMVLPNSMYEQCPGYPHIFKKIG